ncbi:MAG: hypothetical protein ACLQU5_25335 [Isosphaeraceae bacterium]|jgi:hypothetical protein|nr:hypothetical protein [Planctomycetaceae bacterium]MBV8310927.1 hypothetical protein [Planctomycetaceae bacterium]
MSHPLTIDVPEEVFSYLNKLALQQGKTPETLAQELVSTAVQELEEDPLLRWAGAIDSEISDVAERHDYYIGQALYRELRGNPDE